jgi:hypothetical protein
MNWRDFDDLLLNALFLNALFTSAGIYGIFFIV